MLPLGFASGLPVALTGATLQAWLTVDGVDMTVIGLFSLAALPYTLKFLWSPLLDLYSLCKLGRRKGWILFSQMGIVASLLALATLSPTRHLWSILLFTFLITCLSATQDMAIDAHRTELLALEERGLGASLTITGYRLAMLVSGGLALILGDHLGWPWTYAIMAAIMAVSAVITLFAPDTHPTPIHSKNKGLMMAIQGPIKEFFLRRYALWLLWLILLYKLGDALAGAMTTPFLIRGLGFSPTEVGLVNKTIGLISAILGGISGGAIMLRLNTYRALLVFGLFQAVSNLGFWAMALLGQNMYLFVASVFIENLAGGMGTAAFVSLLMSLCHRQWTATQYALLSGLAAMSRVVVSTPSGWIAEQMGWPCFFFMTFLAGLPGLVILYLLQKRSRFFTEGLH